MTPMVQAAMIGAVPGTLTGLVALWKIIQVGKVADKTHILVNSQFGEQLKINLVSAQALYDTTKNPIHKALLDEARRRLAEHEMKQATVDGGEQ